MTIRYSTTGKAQIGTDYTLSGVPNQVTIMPGSSSTTVVLHAMNNSTGANSKKITLRVMTGPDYKLSSHKKATVTITRGR